MVARCGEVHRITGETDIKIKLEFDGEGKTTINSSIGFLNHMLNLLAFHSKSNLVIEAKGDVEVCDHHIVEDIGISLGIAIKEALGNKLGIKRYSTFHIPMDETLAMASIDISGRPFLYFEGDFKREAIGKFSTEMVKEFFRAVTYNAGITLHLRILYGENDHHKIEALFKAFGKVLREAIIIDGEDASSTKGVL